MNFSVSYAMILSAGNGLYVDIGGTPGAGSNWRVRIFKKNLFFRRLLKSDWFLDENQARKFGEQLANDLRNGGTLEAYLERKPGWTLHRPSH